MEWESSVLHGSNTTIQTFKWSLIKFHERTQPYISKITNKATKNEKYCFPEKKTGHYFL